MGKSPRNESEKSDIKRLSKEYIDISLDVLSQLRRFYGLSYLPDLIFKTRPNIPDGLTPRIVSSWLNGKITRVKKKHLDWVISECKSLDIKNATVKVTPAIVAELQAQVKRTNIGPYAILNGNSLDRPDRCFGQQISNLIRGKTAKVPKSHLDYVRARWESLPDYVLPPKKPPVIPQGTPRPGYFLLKRSDLKNLRAYRELGFLPSAVFKFVKNVPKGLNPAMISSWMNEDSPFAQEDCFLFVSKECAKLKKHPQRPTTINEKLYERLRVHRERTGVGGTRLLNGAKNVPKGLSRAIINAWMCKNTSTARKEHLDYVLKLWAALPDKGLGDIAAENPTTQVQGRSAKTKVTKRMLNKLLAHKKRTGIGAYAITKGRKEAKPKGLNGKSLSNILNGESDFIKQEHLDYILARYEDTPDKPKSMPRHRNGSASIRAKAGYEVLSEQNLKKQLLNARRKTKTGANTDFNLYPKITVYALKKIKEHIENGLTISIIFQLTKDMPITITQPLVMSWINGIQKTANPEFVKFYLKACNAAAKHPQRPIEIDEQSYQQLIKNRDRTGVSAQVLLKNTKIKPAGLIANTIYGWLSKETQVARKDYLNFVIALWKSLPDKETISDDTKERSATQHPLLEKKWIRDKREFDKKYPVEEKARTVEKKTPAPKALIVITYDMHQQLMVYNQQAHISGAQLLKNAKNAPQGLRPEMIDNWIIERFKTARKDHWDYVMALYEVRMQK